MSEFCLFLIKDKLILHVHDGRFQGGAFFRFHFRFLSAVSTFDLHFFQFLLDGVSVRTAKRCGPRARAFRSFVRVTFQWRLTESVIEAKR